MSKIEMYSKKLGKTVTIQAASGKRPANGIEMMGWMQSGWSRDTGWKYPPKR